LKLRWLEAKKIIAVNGGNSVEGYEIVFSSVVDFSVLGVPQKQKRSIIIGVRKNLLSGNLEPARRIGKSLEKVLSRSPWLFCRYSSPR